MNEKKDVTVKISGNALKQIMAARGEREKHTGRITSIAELVREAIEFWYDRAAWYDRVLGRGSKK